MHTYAMKSKNAIRKSRRHHPARHVQVTPNIKAQQAKIHRILTSGKGQSRPGTVIALRRKVRRKPLPTIKHIKVKFTKVSYSRGQYFPKGSLTATYKSSKHRFQKIIASGV